MSFPNGHKDRKEYTTDGFNMSICTRIQSEYIEDMQSICQDANCWLNISFQNDLRKFENSFLTYSLSTQKTLQVKPEQSFLDFSYGLFEACGFNGRPQLFNHLVSE